MSKKTLWFSATAAAMLVAGAVLAAPKPAARAISAHQISKSSDPLSADAVRGHKGTLLGVTADPRARAFLNQNGILH
jgi:hypothetical protein